MPAGATLPHCEQAFRPFLRNNTCPTLYADASFPVPPYKAYLNKGLFSPMRSSSSSVNLVLNSSSVTMAFLALALFRSSSRTVAATSPAVAKASDVP